MKTTDTPRRFTAAWLRHQLTTSKAAVAALHAGIIYLKTVPSTAIRPEPPSAEDADFEVGIMAANGRIREACRVVESALARADELAALRDEAEKLAAARIALHYPPPGWELTRLADGDVCTTSEDGRWVVAFSANDDATREAEYDLTVRRFDDKGAAAAYHGRLAAGFERAGEEDSVMAAVRAENREVRTVEEIELGRDAAVKTRLAEVAAAPDRPSRTLVCPGCDERSEHVSGVAPFFCRCGVQLDWMVDEAPRNDRAASALREGDFAWFEARLAEVDEARERIARGERRFPIRDVTADELAEDHAATLKSDLDDERGERLAGIAANGDTEWPFERWLAASGAKFNPFATVVPVSFAVLLAWTAFAAGQQAAAHHQDPDAARKARHLSHIEGAVCDAEQGFEGRVSPPAGVSDSARPFQEVG
jgi:hypothetical protein